LFFCQALSKPPATTGRKARSRLTSRGFPNMNKCPSRTL
jgi:hypothetical protein